MIYLFGWVLIYFSLAVGALANYRGRFLGGVAIFFISVVSIFRGATGTDTASYEFLVGSLSWDSLFTGLEPGFVIFSGVLFAFFDNSEVVVRLLSFLFFVVIFYYYWRSDSNEYFLLVSYFAPAYLFIYSMNGLRIGIASAFLLLAARYYSNRRAGKSMLFMLLSLSFHYTVFFSIFFLLINSVRRVSIKYCIVGVLLLVFLLYVAQGYFLEKIAAYSGYESPGPLSGLSKFLVIAIFIFAILLSELPVVLRMKVAVSAAFFSMLAMLLSSFTYAGLRILDLIAFALPMIFLVLYGERNIYFGFKVRLLFVLAGLLSVVAVYRGFIIEAGHGGSPFLSYKFIF